MKDKIVNSFVDELVKQWPCSIPNHPYESPHSTYLNVSSAMASVNSQWRIWYGNLQFRNYLGEFVSRLNEIQIGSVNMPTYRIKSIRLPYVLKDTYLLMMCFLIHPHRFMGQNLRH